jgi:hypothetical protein
MFSDVPGAVADRFPSVWTHARSVYELAGEEVDRLYGVGWFGSTQITLIAVGLMLGFPIMRLRRQSTAFVMTAFGANLYALLFLLTRPNFSQAFSRYMLYPATFLLVLGGVVLDHLLSVANTRRRTVLQVVMVVMCAAVVLQGSWSLLGNGTRPLVGKDKAWGKSDTELILYANGFVDRGASELVIRDLNSCLPPSATVFVALPFKFPLARLFGDQYARDVRFLPLGQRVKLSRQTMRMMGADAVIVDDVYQDRIEIVADGLYRISSGQYTLMRLPSSRIGCG